MTETIKRRYLPLDLQMFADGDPDPSQNTDPGTPPEPDKTFTQAEVDEILAKRLARDRKGREDYDEIKTKLTALEQGEALLTAAKEEAESRVQEAEGLLTKAIETANQRLIKAEFRTLAATGDVKIRPDALEDAFKLADISSVRVDADGNVSGMVDVIKALAESKPYLKDQPGPSRQIGGDTNGGNSSIDTSTMGARDKMAMGYASASK